MPPTASTLQGIESPTIHQQMKASGVAQVIVVMKSAATAAGATPPQNLMNRFRSSELSQASALVNARHARPSAQTAAAYSTRRQAPQPAVRVYSNLGVMYGTVDQRGLEALRADSRVASVTGAPQFSLIRPTVVGEAKLAAEVTWGIEKLGVKKLWDQGLSGQGVRVAHLDTGIDGKHPALRTAIAAFVEFDSLGEMRKPPSPYDSDEHGTHTAATIAGRPVNGKHVGVAPKADLVGALVIEGGEVIARVLGGFDWALTQGVKVLSMSLGFRGWWEDFLPVTQILRSRGVLPVIAVGNEGPGTSRSPGNYPHALSVGAADENFTVADFSSSQRFARAQDQIVPDLVGPGVKILSAKPGGAYQILNGTSMATPHIAGLAAILFEARPNAGVNDIESALFQSCRLLGNETEERANRGFPDAARALEILTGVAPASSKGKSAVKAAPGRRRRKKRRNIARNEKTQASSTKKRR